MKLGRRGELGLYEGEYPSQGPRPPAASSKRGGGFRDRLSSHRYSLVAPTPIYRRRAWRAGMDKGLLAYVSIREPSPGRVRHPWPSSLALCCAASSANLSARLALWIPPTGPLHSSRLAARHTGHGASSASASASLSSDFMESPLAWSVPLDCPTLRRSHHQAESAGAGQTYEWHKREVVMVISSG